MSAVEDKDGAAKEVMQTRRKRVKSEEVLIVKEEKGEEPIVVLKDPYWVGQDVDGGYKIRKEILDKGHKFVVLTLDRYGHFNERISLGCRPINGGFLGWNQSHEYPVTLYQEGREAVLSLHKSHGTEEIRLTIECPY